MTTDQAEPVLPGKVFIALGAAMFLVMGVSLMLGPLLVDLAEEFHTSVAVTGQLASATFIAWAVVAPLVGPISDSYGRRPIALTGLGLVTLGLVGSGLAVNYEMIFAFRTITGIGSAMIPPNSGGVIADLLPPRNRGKYFGRLIGVATVGSALIVPVTALLSGVGSWRIPFLAFGVMAAVVWTMSWRWFPSSQSVVSQSMTLVTRFKQIGSNGMLWYVICSNAAQRMVYFAMFSYLAAYLTETYGKSTGDTALPLALVGLGAILGAFIGSVVAGRAARLAVASACSLGGGIAAVVLFSAGISEWMVIALGFGVAAFFSIGWPVLTTRLTELAGPSTATALGFFAASNQLGAVGGSAIGGLALALGGFSMVGVFCLAVAAVAATVLRFKVRESPEFSRALDAG